MLNLKYNLKVLIIILSSVFIYSCSQPISFEVNKGELRESEEPYNLSSGQVKNAEALYLAIRDKDKAEIQKIVSADVFVELEKDPIALAELSSYIPYYEKLISKKMIEYTETNHTKYGDLIMVIFKYTYEKRTVYYSVTFKKDDLKNQIVGTHFGLKQ